MTMIARHHRFSPRNVHRREGIKEGESSNAGRGESRIENGGTQCNAIRLGSGVNDGGYEGRLLLSLLFFLNSAPYSGLYSIETGGMK